MIELIKHHKKLLKKANEINKLKKQVKELSNPEQTESYYKAEYLRLIDDVEEYKQIEYDLTEENEELKVEILALLETISES